MKKLTKLILLTACTLLLTGCSQQGASLPGSDTHSSPTEERTDNSFSNTVLPENDITPPKEGMVRSPLTNEWVDADVAATRPIAVTIPNESAAIPHYNLSKASILYEANVEGQMTRMLAIFEDWKDLERIGNVRSLRTYFAYWSFEWDAFLVHFGGPYYINDLIALPDTENINGSEVLDGNAFYRTKDRKSPHNAYVSGRSLLGIINDKDYSTAYRGLSDEEHFQFTTKSAPNTLAAYGSDAKTATYIDMSGSYPLTRCYFEYNEDDGLYYRSQHLSGSTDGPHIDAATGEQLTFKNILVQNVYQEDLGDGYLVFQCHDTTRDGWYFTGGKGIHVTWEKTSDYGATRYYDDNGEEITLNTGKTMICIIEDGDSFSFH